MKPLSLRMMASEDTYHSLWSMVSDQVHSTSSAPWRLAAVSYVNTWPFLQGIAGQPSLAHRVDIIKAAPADCAMLFERGDADIALVPVGALDQLSDYQRITSYGIGSQGAVETVVLCADRPVEALHHITLDPDSRSSSALLRILLAGHWHHSPTCTKGDVTQPPKDTHTGRLLIGDKVLSLAKGAQYVYDLGEVWTSWTGLPMVFAVWIARNGVAKEVEDDLEQAFSQGQRMIPSIDLSTLAHQAYWRRYLSEVIKYEIDASAEQAIVHYRRLKSKLDASSH